MPCTYDDVPRVTRETKHGMNIADFQAALCGVLTVNEAVLKKVNWDEAGVTKAQVMHWWTNHQREDAERIARENKEKEEKRIRAEALAKLTPEEKKILGV